MEKTASSKGLGSSIEVRLAHIDANKVRIAINTDQQLAVELEEIIASQGKEILQLIIFPKDVVFAKDSSTVVIEVKGTDTSESDTKEYTLTTDNVSEINSLLKGGSKVVVGRVARRKLTMHKKTVYIDWPYYVRCGVCSHEVSLRIDGCSRGKASNFHRKHFDAHSHDDNKYSGKRKQNRYDFSICSLHILLQNFERHPFSETSNFSLLLHVFWCKHFTKFCVKTPPLCFVLKPTKCCAPKIGVFQISD